MSSQTPNVGPVPPSDVSFKEGHIINIVNRIKSLEDKVADLDKVVFKLKAKNEKKITEPANI